MTRARDKGKVGGFKSVNKGKMSLKLSTLRRGVYEIKSSINKFDLGFGRTKKRKDRKLFSGGPRLFKPRGVGQSIIKTQKHL